MYGKEVQILWDHQSAIYLRSLELVLGIVKLDRVGSILQFGYRILFGKANPLEDALSRHVSDV